MGQTVELSSLDLRFAGYRWRDKAREARLLASIAERGIEQPLEGVDGPQGRLLLDGLNRFEDLSFRHVFVCVFGRGHLLLDR